MPLYDFKCPHGHEFERQCKIAEREELVPCEGLVNQLVEDELYDKHSAEPDLPLPEGLFWMALGLETQEFSDVVVPTEDDGQIEQVLMRKVPCSFQAKIFMGVHNNPGGALDHGLGSNRDAAREGRYNPLEPNRRFMAKGRGYRK
jgi:hypothetical protein